MRKHLIYMAGASLMMLSCTSCDNIDEQDRLIPIERPHSEKVVLLEEFTGATCVNCPNGASTVHSMLESEAFKGKLVAVSLYPSQMANLTTPITTDLRTPEATEYFSAYDGTSKGLPSAMMDRTPYKGSVLQLLPPTWSGVVSEMLKEQSPVTLDLTSTYDASSRNLTVSYTVDYNDPVQEEVYMQLWVVENGILSIQASTTGLIYDYENNHVLRAAINGTWGESLGASHIPGSQSAGMASITLKQDWVPENVQVVGFAYRASDRRVLQAHLLSSITE